MTFSKIAPALRALGYETLPLWPKKKNPSIDGWQSIEITEERVSSWASNGKADHGVGIRTGTGEIALYGADNDFYDKDVAVAVRASFVEYFGKGVVRVGQAPKSLMVYAGPPGCAKITSPTWVSPDGKEHKFEMLGAGQQFVAYGIHEKTGKEYRWPEGSLLDVEPWELIEIDPVDVVAWVRDTLPGLIPADWHVKGGSSDGTAGGVTQPTDAAERALLNYKPKLDIDWDEVRRAVMLLDPSMGRDEWYRVLMAIHHQCDGADMGLDLADEWSKAGSNYSGRRDVEVVWRSIKDNPARGAVVTMASVLKMARETPGWVEMEKGEKQAALKGWIDRIAECKDPHDVQHLLEVGVATDTILSVVDRAQIEAAAKNKFQALGVNIPVGQIRGMMAPRRDRGNDVQGHHAAPAMEGWCEPYVWCVFDDAFIHVPTQEMVSTQSFNAKHGRDVKNRWMTAEGFQMSAVQVALQELQVPIVSRRMYLPWAIERFSMDGLDYLNTYRPSSVPEAKPKDQWDAEDQAAIDAVIKHMRDLIGEKESTGLIQWMAYCVQNPGRKIRWSPLIKGIEGDGKTLFGEVLAHVMGRPNVRMIAPKVLLTDFNGYAEGSCVGVLEELKMAGHNRHDAANALKPNVTNDTIDIHRKGKDPYNILNTMNYIAFTNYGDALPLTDSDRRWWVLFSLYTKKEQLPPAAVFDRIFDLIRNHVGALRAWLLGVDMTSFKPNGRAPDSVGKDSMVAAALHEEDEAILEVIAAGVVGVSEDVVSTSHLTNRISMTDPSLVLRTRSLATAMTRLGYVKVKGLIKWDGHPYRVWVKDVRHVEDKEKIRHLLDVTKGDDSNVTDEF